VVKGREAMGKTSPGSWLARLAYLAWLVIGSRSCTWATTPPVCTWEPIVCDKGAHSRYEHHKVEAQRKSNVLDSSPSQEMSAPMTPYPMHQALSLFCPTHAVMIHKSALRTTTLYNHHQLSLRVSASDMSEEFRRGASCVSASAIAASSDMLKVAARYWA